MIRLDPEWSRLMLSYEDRHRDARNRRCHRVGIPLLAASVPVGLTVVGLPLAASLFVLGSTFQAVGHWFEKQKPAFIGDPRHVVVGLLWWLKESGVGVELSDPAA